uniref:Uncharacterized protein n=1 Tax=Candidatus Kentrum eta TaxID=2126337 RepID=A0A450U9L3_9GAMM|nr:MAG: hypothetical protein BECKH772A_GA0070896_1001026 [Candidatus Kentron sp. H]VFJ90763.1 MAG: hypothetical protein BECKH772B_GA0070898_1001126 [Candidatus Kentron sp. H]VFJ96897.1 MAG: hypothetical protein BECKH772C_GA0070978_1000926 [Candidatus Kentron sp. H]
MKNYPACWFFTALFTLLAHPAAVLAVEVAPRISDREIIERLTGLEAGQQALQRQMEAMQKQTEQRFIALEKRMDAQWTLTLVLIAAIFGLIGFVVWDRKAALKPLERHVARVADDLERDLDLRSMDALREVALDDPRLADVLQRRSL